jgi:hypothetical protein
MKNETIKPMKASEFYEKHFLVNGKKPKPLTDVQKEFIDHISDGGSAVLIRTRTGGRRLLSHAISQFKSELKRVPDFLKP